MRDARFDGGISSHAEDFPSRAHTAMRRDDAHERDSRGYCEILGRSSGSCRRYETQDDQEIILRLRVAEDDMGKVIGKQGRIAKALRSVVKAAATKENKRATVEIG